MRTWKDVATLVKPRNLKGKFVARCAADFPFALEEGDVVAFVPPQTDLPRRGTVNYVHELGGSEYEVGFEEIVDEAGAHGLAGCHCLIERCEIDESLFAEEPATWQGWEVVSVDGEPVGAVAALIENPGQALLEVDRADGEGAVLVPVVDEIVVDVDVEGRRVTVNLPAGLLDL